MLTGNLEYTISSLPHLIFSDDDSFKHKVISLLRSYALDSNNTQSPLAIFNQDISKYLSSRDYDLVDRIHLSTIHDTAFQSNNLKSIADFSQFMAQLKQELKTYRTNRNNQQSDSKENYKFISAMPNSPLDAELYLLNIQWQKLDELSDRHYADLSALILYKLKLELLQRWWSFDTETGFNTFQQTLSQE